SNKLNYKKLKLFKIIKKVLLINYELRLLDIIRYYPVFYILLLKPILRGLYIKNYIIIKLN
ncbi:uncharacterized protein CLUP02_11756, partial [Colletotrichum lupini]